MSYIKLKSLFSISLFSLLVLLLNTSYTQAQQTVTGKVIDGNDGAPLIGASIVIKGTSIGTVTDINGEYKLVVNSANDFIIFSFIGYLPEEIDVGAKTIIDMSLVMDISELGEVVITALGISREEKSLGYSVGKVSSDELTKVAQENVLEALSGKVSGVQISSTGGPGSSSSIIIRGATSLNTDNQPLFIIDGVPVSNSLNNVSQLAGGQVDYGNAIADINPNDIESVSVLKGPSAAALYGSRAGNGVVMITTKTGAKKKEGIGVYVNSGVTFDKPYKFLPQQTQYTSGALGLAMYDEEEGYWYGPETDVGVEAKQWSNNGEKAPLVAYPNKTEEFLNTGVTFNNNVGIAGNYDKGSFRLSIADMSNEGVIPNTNLNRITLSLSTTYKITEDCNVSTNINIVDNSSDNLSAGGQSEANVLYSLDNIPPHISLGHLSGNYWEEGLEDIQQRTFAPEADNPYFVANELTNSFNRNRYYGNVQLNWHFLPKINFMARVSLDKSSETRESKVPWSYSAARWGAYGIQKVDNQEMNSDFLVAYNDKLGDFQLNISAGGNYRNANGNNLINKASRLTIPALYTISNAEGGLTEYDNFSYQKVVYSLYGLSTASYKNMIYLDLTARNDWSSTLPENNRSYFYPSASLSFLLNEMIDLPTAFDLVKLRGGVAQVGNDTDPYRLNSSLEVLQDWGNLARVYESGDLLTENLKPEIATSYEIGGDFNFFKNRIGLSPTYYVVQNKNQILRIEDMPASSGYNSQQINAGLIESRGWEVSLNTTPILKNDFKWDLNFSVSRNRTKILELTDDMQYFTLYSEGGVVARTMVGEEIGDIWGLDYIRVEDKSSEYYGYPLLVVDEDYGVAILQTAPEEDRVKLGNFNHDFLIGIQSTLSYKNFSLFANIDWRQGGDFFSNTYRKRQNAGRLKDNLSGASYNDISSLPDEIKANPDAYFGNWVGGMSYEHGGFDYPTGTSNFIYNLGNIFAPGSAAFIPGVYLDKNGNYVENLGDPSTTLYTFTALAVGEMWDQSYQYIFDASFIKLREIALTYSIPQSLLSKVKIQRIAVSIFAKNIILWTANDQNIDPERAFGFSNNGFEQGLESFNMLPWIGSVGFKLNLDF